MIYWQLFLSFLQIGALSFGGGYAAMPLIEAQIIRTHGWLTTAEFADLVTIAEMTPGPIAVNAATFVGTKIGGIPGALAATAGCVLPACVLYHSAECFLGWRDHCADADESGHGRHLRPVLCAAAPDQMESHCCDGAGRSAEPGAVHDLIRRLYDL